jgi:hypothetical protein
VKVEPQGNVDEKETGTGSKESNGENDGGTEGISKFSTDNVTGGVGAHKDSVHGRQDGGRKASRGLKLLLDSRIALAREMRHEVTSKGHKEGPSVEKAK